MTENNKLGHRQRLKERFMKAPYSLPDYELLELLMFNAIPRRDVKSIAKRLINAYGNLGKILNIEDCKINDKALGITSGIFLQFSLINEIISRVLRGKIEDKPLLNNMNLVYDYLRSNLGNKEVENFRVLFLNTKNYLVADETQVYGTIDQTQIYPREVLKRAIFHQAAAIIIAHNHPSGVPKPSKADIFVTQKIVEACKTIDVEVHDHIITTERDIFSFRSNNLL